MLDGVVYRVEVELKQHGAVSSTHIVSLLRNVLHEGLHCMSLIHSKPWTYEGHVPTVLT